jgi:cobalt-precorrin-5B (C1)-methyltransferase
MRYGFTTGSCAAAAAKAATYMLLTGQKKTEITIETPKGISFHTEICDILLSEKEVSCAVLKDGGDDPDVTTGALIYAKIKIEKEEDKALHIYIDGGIGVGRVTRPGLDQSVGNVAINHVPREMIRKEVIEVCEMVDYRGRLSVEISVPTGEELAKRTFNPRLGIEGGISILGTSGIVEPMSTQAIFDTIKAELSQKKAEGKQIAAISPGNYGLEFLKKTYGYDLDKSIKCSNFIGDTIDMAIEKGFRAILLTGHIGKLIKLSGGIMNTHSKEGDCRMELFAAAAIQERMEYESILKILDCVTTEEVLMILKEQNVLDAVMKRIIHKIIFYLGKRAKGNIRIECIMYSNDYGELAGSSGAKKLVEEVLQEG